MIHWSMSKKPTYEVCTAVVSDAPTIAKIHFGFEALVPDSQTLSEFYRKRRTDDVKYTHLDKDLMDAMLASGRWQDRIEKSTSGESDELILSAVTNGNVVSFLHAKTLSFRGANRFYIETIATHKDHRRHGAGARLISTANAVARERGYTWATCMSASAKGFYLARDQGFRYVKDRQPNEPRGSELKMFRRSHAFQDMGMMATRL